MKNRNIKILIFLLVVLSITLLCGCGNFVVIEGIRMKDTEAIEITIGDFSYEGKKIIVEYADGTDREIDLTEDMIPAAERLKFYKIGEQEIKVIYNDRYVTTFNVNVQRRVFDDVYQLNGYTVTYDGKPHRVELNRELPEGATIEFEYGNTFTNAGSYEVACVISKEGYVSKRLTTTLLIEKADFDQSLLGMQDKTYVYDGDAKSIQVTGVPEGISVSYEIYDGDIRVNRAIGAGEYRVVAHFTATNSNYNKVSDLSAKLTIEKADYDMSKVVFRDHEKAYDGTEFVPYLDPSSVLPQGVTVSYSITKDGEKTLSNAKVGEYEMTASFNGNTVNYNPIPDMTAKLTVFERTINISNAVSMDDMTLNFDGETHSLKLNGTLPQGVNVTFENNDKIYAGEYDVVARFSTTSANDKVDVEEIHAYLIINQIRGSVKINGQDVTEDDLYYDSDKKTMRIWGLDEDIYGIRSFKFYSTDGEETVIEWGSDDFTLEAGETYSYSIKFYYIDENMEKSVRLSDSTGSYTHHEIEFNDKEVEYNGEIQTIVAEYVSKGIDVTYDYYYKGNLIENAVTAGEYKVVAHFNHNGETAFPDKTATLNIIKATIDMSSVLFEDESVVYDGDNHTVTAQFLPECVFATYKIYNGDNLVSAAKNAGEYRIVAHFTVDYDNYNKIPDEEILLTIEKRVISIEGMVVFEDATFDYDGEEHTLQIQGDLPSNVNVIYDKNSYTQYGMYEITASFVPVDSENETVDIEKLTATLIIRREFTGEGITFEDVVVDFEFDTVHSIAISGELFDGVGVEYENNGHTYAGVYEVTAHFVALNNIVFVTAPDLTATLTINKIESDIMINGHVINASDFLYDRNENIMNVNGFDPEVYDYELIFVEWHPKPNMSTCFWFRPRWNATNRLENNIEYHYEITFNYHDINLRNSVTLKKATGWFTYDVDSNVCTEITK